MATQEEWYNKLKAWVPTWFFNEIENNEAVFQAIARVLYELELRATEHQTETFIAQAEAGYLDEHGLERNLTRGTGEIDVAFAERIRYISNSTPKPAIKRLVDALLDVGECTIVEDFESTVFLSREVYYKRGNIFLEPIKNTFSIIVDKQVHAPYSFHTREYFYGREDFIGTDESSIELFELIVEAVNKAKALGTLYRVIERVG